MAADPATERVTTDSVRRFRFEPVSLGGGWSGRVLTRCEGVARAEAASSPALPSAKQWQGLLGPLATDPASMPDYEVLKYSTRGEVFRARLAWGDQSLDVACKQSRAHGFWGRLTSPWRRSREHRNFDQAVELLQAGIGTALPVAWIERRWPKREAWLITEFVPGLVDLDQVALTLLPQLDSGCLHMVKAAILEAIVKLVYRMERRGLYHRDLKASNLLLQSWDGGRGPVRVLLVDLDGIGRGAPWDASRRWKPLVRLAASLVGYASITPCDYGRFLQRYLARTGLSRETWKPRFCEIGRRVADYVRRAESRKVGKLDGFTGERRH